MKSGRKTEMSITEYYQKREEVFRKHQKEYNKKIATELGLPVEKIKNMTLIDMKEHIKNKHKSIK